MQKLVPIAMVLSSALLPAIGSAKGCIKGAAAPGQPQNPPPAQPSAPVAPGAAAPNR